MSTIDRWNPNRELSGLLRRLDRFLSESFEPGAAELRCGEGRMALDMMEDDLKFTLIVELPGVRTETICVSLDGSYLYIEAEIPQSLIERKEGGRVLVQERACGKFSRSISLPRPVEIEHAEAEFENGILTLRLPKVTANKSKIVPVRTDKSDRKRATDTHIMPWN